MKNIFLHSLLCSCLTQAITAQTDTLLANSTHTMALFFSSPVRQAITGSENFTFSFNTNTAHSLGLLQAKPGPGSNLLVLTEDGKSYMFELKYTPHLLRTYRFIKQEEGLDNPSTYPGVRDSIAKSSSAPTKSDSIDYKKGSVFVLSSATNVLKTKRKYGLVLKLLDIAYYGREVYLAYEIENRSEIDYELDDLKCFKTTGSPGKKSSFQKLELIPRYIYRQPQIIRPAFSSKFIIVLPKFTLARKEKFLLEVKEKYGSRSLSLKK